MATNQGTPPTTHVESGDKPAEPCIIDPMKEITYSSLPPSPPPSSHP